MNLINSIKMSFVVGEFTDKEIVLLLDQVEYGSKVLLINPLNKEEHSFYLITASPANRGPARLVAQVSFTQVIITLMDPKRNILQQSHITLSTLKDTFYFVSCDHVEADTNPSLWNTLMDDIKDQETTGVCIHLGDNVYADHAWNQSIKYPNVDPKEFYRRRYRRTWFRNPDKRNVLASVSNLMIWDDHEIVNDANILELISGTGGTGGTGRERIINAAVDVYEEYQESLFLTPKDKNTPTGGRFFDSEIGDKSWYKMVGDILVICIERTTSGRPSSQKIVDRLDELFNYYEDHDMIDEIRGLILCTSWAPVPPPEGNRSSQWYRRLKGGSKFVDKNELSILYHYLLDWSSQTRPVMLVGGDIHFGLRGTVTRGDKMIHVMVSSGITNHPTYDRRLAARAYIGTIPIDDDILVGSDHVIEGYNNISDDIPYFHVEQSEGRRCYGRLTIERYEGVAMIFMPRLVYNPITRPRSYIRYLKSLYSMK